MHLVPTGLASKKAHVSVKPSSLFDSQILTGNYIYSWHSLLKGLWIPTVQLVLECCVIWVHRLFHFLSCSLLDFCFCSLSGLVKFEWGKRDLEEMWKKPWKLSITYLPVTAKWLLLQPDGKMFASKGQDLCSSLTAKRVTQIHLIACVGVWTW